LYYGIVDISGKIIYCSYSDFDNDTQLWNGFGIYYQDFIDNLSVNGSGIFLIIGEVTVGNQQSLENAMIRDVRTSGGGVKKNRVDTVIEDQNAEVSMYWDVGFWDGMPYPGLSSYLVEVPVDILSGAGGVLSQNQVKDFIDKHTALGVYPIVKAYGIDPIVTEVIPHSTSIELEWNSYGSDVLYNVYYTQSLDNPWTKATVSEIVDNHLGNSYTITGLSLGVIYYITIVGGKLNDDGDWAPLIGQDVGPVDIGIIENMRSNIILVRTYG
jgi:hypothetical protein